LRRGLSWLGTTRPSRLEDLQEQPGSIGIRQGARTFAIRRADQPDPMPAKARILSVARIMVAAACAAVEAPPTAQEDDTMLADFAVATALKHGKAMRPGLRLAIDGPTPFRPAFLRYWHDDGEMGPIPLDPDIPAPPTTLTVNAHGDSITVWPPVILVPYENQIDLMRIAARAHTTMQNRKEERP
jgi:hypothetical protein